MLQQLDKDGYFRLPYPESMGSRFPPEYPAEMEYLPPRIEITGLFGSVREFAPEEYMSIIGEQLRQFFAAQIQSGYFSSKMLTPVVFGFTEYELDSHKLKFCYRIEYYAGQNSNEFENNMVFSFTFQMREMSRGYEEYMLEGLKSHLREKCHTNINASQIYVRVEHDELRRNLHYTEQAKINNEKLHLIEKLEMNSIFERWNKLKLKSGQSFPLETAESLKVNPPVNLKEFHLGQEAKRKDAIREKRKYEKQKREEQEKEAEKTYRETTLHLPFDPKNFNSDQVEVAENYLNGLQLPELVGIAEAIGMSNIKRNKTVLVFDMIEFMEDQ